MSRLGQTTIPVPFDPPHTVTLQRLNGWDLEKARKRALNLLMQDIADRGGAKAQKEMEEFFKPTEDPDPVDAKAPTPAPPAAPVNPLFHYDTRTLILKGVVSFTADPRPIAEAIEELSDEEIEFFATEALRFTKPGLFQTVAEVKAAQKND